MRRYPDNIFRYPLVQYIPLRQQKDHIFDHNFTTDKIHLFIYQDQTQLEQRLNSFNKNLKFEIDSNEMAVLTINKIVEMVKYRGYEVLLVGKNKHGKIHLFKITKDYFYKNRLIFNLYNRENGIISARRSLQI